jgi:hypothetical protein
VLHLCILSPSWRVASVVLSRPARLLHALQAGSVVAGQHQNRSSLLEFCDGYGPLPLCKVTIENDIKRLSCGRMWPYKREAAINGKKEVLSL